MRLKIDFSRYYDCINKSYVPLVNDKKRFQVVYGGSGSGKSHFVAQDEIFKQVFQKGTNLLIVRQTSKSNRTSTFPLIKQVIAEFKLNQIFDVNKTEMTIRCLLNDNEIRFGGLDDVEKIKSTTFTTGPLSRIWIEEASETKETDFNQLNLRLRGLSKVPFQMRLTFNPISSMHWLKSRFFDMPEERQRTTIHHTTYLDNRFIDSAYKEELERLKNIDKTFYEVYCLGRWGVFGNIIFTNWEAKKCPYSIDDFDEVLYGKDFGYNHPFALEGLGIKDGDLYSFSELYLREKTNKEVIEINEAENVLSKKQVCTADSAEPARIKEWQQHGYRTKGAIKGKDSVSRGIDFLKGFKWYIDPDQCPGLLAEVQTYSYKEDKHGNRTDEPINYKDDGIAAVRYALEDKARANLKMKISDEAIKCARANVTRRSGNKRRMY